MISTRKPRFGVAAAQCISDPRANTLQIFTLDVLYELLTGSTPFDPKALLAARGMAWGEFVANAILMWRSADGRPFDSTVNGARMIASGVFDRHPKLQVLIVHMGGGLASILGRLEFNWHLIYKGFANRPAGKSYTNKRSPP